MLAVVAPGQGAQSPGQLEAWLESGAARGRLAWWSEAAGLDLIAAGTTATADEIRDTAVAQPLLVATGMLAATGLGLLPGAGADEPTGGAGGIVLGGHSVGELTAAALAGALEPEAALLFVRVRGRAMAAAAAATPTGMTAVLGGEPDEVEAHLAGLGLIAANRNGAGQIVAAGTLTDLARLAEDRPPKAKLRSLTVAGAFHTEHMRPALEALAAVAPGVRPHDPRRPLVSNADGTLVTDGADLLARLVTQVAAPVRWDLCTETFRRLGVDAVIELAPAGALAGILRRELPGVRIVQVKGPDDLGAARELLGEHAPALAGTTT